MILRELSKKKSLVTYVVVIYVILNILSMVVFARFAISNSEEESLTNSKNSILEMVGEKGTCIEDAFALAESNIELLGVLMEKELKHKENIELGNDYKILRDGTLVREKDENKENDEQSNVIRPNTKHLTKDMISALIMTEELDDAFSKIVQNETIIWTYIVTNNNILRCCPYTDLTKFYDGAHTQLNDSFYKDANENNNPEHKIVWTDPYYDYLGEGWVKTCSRPIYDQDGKLFGVVSIDVSIKKIQEIYFKDFKIGDTDKVCWADKEGNVFYHSDYSVMTASQGEKLSKNVFKEDMEISESEAKKTAFEGGEGITYFYDGSDKMLVYTELEGIDSILYLEIDLEQWKASTKINATSIWIMLVIELAIAIIAALILYKYLSNPLKRLVRRSEKISQGDYKIEEDGKEPPFYEIESLNMAFDAMSRNIEQYTDDLIAKNNELHTIMEAIDETLMITNLEGEIVIKAKEKVLPKEITQNGINNVMREEKTFEEKIVYDGEVYKNAYYPIFKDGKVSNIVISSACVTKSVLIEKELQQVEKMAGVGQLAAAIVHELKNSLALINGATYILKMTSQGDEKEIETINSAVKEAENIIQTLLDFSQKGTDGIEAVHLNTVFNQILLLARKEIITKGITVNMNIDDNCYLYSSGREAIKVIMQNIVLNAIEQFSTDGEIVIEAIEDNGMTSIMITDNAGGIVFEDKESIFKPYVTSKKDGHGIGLWITKQLVDGLGGAISVIEPKEGMTTFTINLPSEEKGQENEDINNR